MINAGETETRTSIHGQIFLPCRRPGSKIIHLEVLKNFGYDADIQIPAKGIHIKKQNGNTVQPNPEPGRNHAFCEL